MDAGVLNEYDRSKEGIVPFVWFPHQFVVRPSFT